MKSKLVSKLKEKFRSRKYKSLAEERPDLLEEWVWEKNPGIDPARITAGSEKKAVWKCKKCGQEWTAMIAKRAIRNTGCPVCAGHVVVAGVNDLASRHKEITAEWNYSRNGELRPDQVTAGSNKKVWWICQNGHEWEAAISSRTTNGAGCPYDAGKKVLSGFNDLKSRRPDVAGE